MEQMTEILHFRVTPTLMEAIKARAKRMGLRYQDIVRMDLAKASLGGVPLERANQLVDSPASYTTEKEPA